jgi:hypothetical protein
VISTKHLAGLPGIDALKALSQSLALLDAILCPEWEYRYYSFNARWNAGEAMASMRNGQGDGYFALFTSAGAILKGFAHEAPMAPHRQEPPRIWPGVLDEVPAAFGSFLGEPAFSMEDTTFCIWRQYADASWQCGPIAYPPGKDPDGSAALLRVLDGEPETYRAWAEAYHERPVSAAAVARIYRHEPLTAAVVTMLNAELSLAELAQDLEEIEYPARRG